MIDFFKGINLWEIDKLITTIISKLSITTQNAIICFLSRIFIWWFTTWLISPANIYKKKVKLKKTCFVYCTGYTVLPLIDPFQTLDKGNNRSSQTWFNLRQRVCSSVFSVLHVWKLKFVHSGDKVLTTKDKLRSFKFFFLINQVRFSR